MSTHFVDSLKRAHLRVTKHRIRVLKVLEMANRPLSHSEILQELMGLDRVTLYRVLASLTQASLVHQVQGCDGIWRFCFHENDSEICPGGHPHVLCRECGQMQCLTGQKIPHYDVEQGFEVLHKQVLITGICKKCQLNMN